MVTILDAFETLSHEFYKNRYVHSVRKKRKFSLTLVDASSSSSIREILLIPSTGEKKEN